MSKFYLRDGVFNFMYDFKEYSEKIENSHENSLKQADKSFKFASKLGLIGLLFFFLALGATYFAHKQEKFTTLSDNIVELSKSITTVTVQLENNEQEDLSKELSKIRDELNDVSLNVKKELVGLNNNFIIISLIGGCFIWLIAIINFYQYGKAISQLADRLDRNQRFMLANNICDQLDDKNNARLTLLKRVADVYSDNNKPNTPDAPSKNTSHNGNSKGSTKPQ